MKTKITVMVPWPGYKIVAYEDNFYHMPIECSGQELEEIVKERKES